jgi:hypothetical protein
VDKSHWETKAGEEVKLRNEPAAVNQAKGATIERQAATQMKAAGGYGRVKGSDPTAPPGTRRTAKALGPVKSEGATVQKGQNLSYDVEKALADASDLTKTEEVTNVLKAASESSKIEKAVAASTKVARAIAPVAKALKPLAPALEVAGRAAGALGIATSAVELATAKNTDERVDAGIGLAGNALLASDNPVAMAAGGGVLAGQYLEHKLNVSDVSSSWGTSTYEGLKSAGVGDTASFVAGGVVTVVSTPAALAVAAYKKVASLW